MGCDIHLYAEKKAADGKWEFLPGLPNPYCPKHKNYHQPIEVVCCEDALPGDDMGCWYSGRNYALFGRLVGIRINHAHGPIAQPRGFPSDASVEVRNEYMGWRSDAHTPSWLLVSEVMEDPHAETLHFRKAIAKAVESGADRIVFWFDN